MEYIDFRCEKCGKLLGRIRGDAEIKCPRCNSLNTLVNQQASTIAVIVSNSKTINGGQTGRLA